MESDSAFRLHSRHAQTSHRRFLPYRLTYHLSVVFCGQQWTFVVNQECVGWRISARKDLGLWCSMDSRGVLRLLCNLGYASLAVKRYFNGLSPVFPAFPNP